MRPYGYTSNVQRSRSEGKPNYCVRTDTHRTYKEAEVKESQTIASVRIHIERTKKQKWRKAKLLRPYGYTSNVQRSRSEGKPNYCVRTVTHRTSHWKGKTFSSNQKWNFISHAWICESNVDSVLLTLQPNAGIYCQRLQKCTRNGRRPLKWAAIIISFATYHNRGFSFTICLSICLAHPTIHSFFIRAWKCSYFLMTLISISLSTLPQMIPLKFIWELVLSLCTSTLPYTYPKWYLLKFIWELVLSLCTSHFVQWFLAFDLALQMLANLNLNVLIKIVLIKNECNREAKPMPCPER